MKYEYKLIVVEREDGTADAFLSYEDSPLRGHGESALQAVRALCEAIREWPISGADRWLGTPDGEQLARQFVPDFKGKQGASS
jgi:hypothetical protein